MHCHVQQDWPNREDCNGVYQVVQHVNRGTKHQLDGAPGKARAVGSSGAVSNLEVVSTLYFNMGW